MSLVELKLTMGCDDPPSADCLASGGKTLELEEMIYGTLTETGSGGYTLQLSILDVTSGAIKDTVSTDLSAEALDAAIIQDTAKDLVEKLLGPVEVPNPPPSNPDLEPEPEPEA